MAWLAHLYELSRVKSAEAGVAIPPFDEFWQAGIAEAKGESREPVMLAAFRADPAAHPLKTPSGRIEIFSEKIASFGYDDCPGHATWLEPIEWLGSKTAERYPLHMLSDQPADKLHSQLDHSPQRAPPRSRAASRSPCIPTTPPRAASPTATWCACSTTAAPASRRRGCRDRIRRGVVRLSTGAWFDPADSGSNRPLEKHGNPNALTLDIGASQAEPGLHRPDLPGRDRALRRAGAGGDGPSSAAPCEPWSASLVMKHWLFRLFPKAPRRVSRTRLSA